MMMRGMTRSMRAAGLAMLFFLVACDWPLEVPAQVELVAPADGASMSLLPVVFSWQPGDDVAGYRLQLSANSGYTAVVADTSVSGTSVALAVTTDGTYYWRVRAMSSDSVWGSWSESRKVILRRFTIATTLSLPGYSHDIAIQSGRAYVAAGQAGLAVLDVLNPETPALLGQFMDSLNEAWGVAVRDSCAYLAYGYTELIVVDVRRPDSLRAFGELGYLQPGYGYDVAVSDTLVYVAAGAQFVRTNVADPRFPGLSFQYSYPRNCRGVVVEGSRGFVACEQLGVAGWRLDANPPVQVGSMDTPANARGLALLGDRLFIADGRGGLIVAEASDPAAITALGSLELNGYAQAVAVQDTLAFVACGSGGFAVVNVARPEQPRLAARLATPYAAAVAVDGRYVFGCDRDLGLVVIRME